MMFRDLMKINNPEEEPVIIDLLHVNCEGCEWEMFENLIETGLLQTNR